MILKKKLNVNEQWNVMKLTYFLKGSNKLSTDLNLSINVFYMHEVQVDYTKNRQSWNLYLNKELLKFFKVW